MSRKVSSERPAKRGIAEFFTDIARALALASVLGLAAAALAQDKGKPAEDPLRPDAPFAADGVVIESIKEGEAAVRLGVGKTVTVVLDLSGKFAVRVDRAEPRGTPPLELLKPGRHAAVYGKEYVVQQTARARGGVGMAQTRIAPWHALVVGEGFDTPTPTAEAKKKLNKDERWWLATVDRAEGPDAVWLKCADGKDRMLAVSRDDRALGTNAYESAAFVAGETRHAFAKGQLVRFKGKIESVLYVDAKGTLVEEAEKRKKGVKAEVHLAATRVALLDAGFDYAYVETPESF